LTRRSRVDILSSTCEVRVPASAGNKTRGANRPAGFVFASTAALLEPRLLLPHQPESDVAHVIGRFSGAAVCECCKLSCVVERAAFKHFLIAGSRTLRIPVQECAVGRVPVTYPLPHVPEHVVQTSAGRMQLSDRMRHTSA